MQTWLVTGASSGLGRSVAEKLLARGDRVAAMMRRPAALEALRATHGERLQLAALDLADIPGVRPQVDRIVARLGRVDAVLGNAGYGLFGAVEEVTDDQVAAQLATNLTGSIAFVRAVLPHLRRQGGGRLLQTSSEGGQTVYPGFGIYHASKWGIEGFMETVAAETAPFGIAVTIVEPGPTRTSFSGNAVRATPMPEYAGTPVDAVRRALADGGFATYGDADRCADAIIACVDAPDPPRRLILGGTAYANVERSLRERLDAVRGQRDAALRVDGEPAS